MSITATIRNNSLLLKPFNVEMVTEQYASWLSDPVVVKYSEQRHRRHSVESCTEYVASVDQITMHMWGIFSDAKHVGNITAHRDPHNLTADIGILIGDRSVWSKGIGSAAWSSVVEWLFADGVRKVTAGTMSENVGMLRIFSKCGMCIDGERPGYFLLDDLPVGLVFASKYQ